MAGGEKTEAELKAEIASASGMLAMVLNAGFYAVSITAGEHWKLNQDEAFSLSTTLTVAIKSSFPESWLQAYEDALAKYAPWVAVTVTAGSIINKRIEIGRAIAAQAQANADNQGVN